jgi:Flp pilus assembly protein TadG
MKLHRQKGVAAVELALILVLMLVLCFGIVEVGRSLYYYNGLVKATRSAARYLTTKDLNSLVSGTQYTSSSTNPDVQAAIALAWCGMTICAGNATSLVPDLAASKVTVTTYKNVSTGVGPISLVTVSIGSANRNDPNAVWFNSFLPFTFDRFNFSPVQITMAWSTT